MKSFNHSRSIVTLLIVFVVLSAGVAMAGSGSAAPVHQVGFSAPGPHVILLHDDRYIPHHVPPPAPAELRIQSATFAVNWNPPGCPGTIVPWPQQAKDAFNFAVTIWSSLLNSSQVIVIDACMRSDLPANYLGQAGPTTIHRDFPGRPIASTWYATALANGLANADLNDADGWDSDGDGNDVDSEIGAEFSSTFDWYFGTDGNTPSDKVDFVSVVLHELGHGLGFSGSGDVDTGDNACGTGVPGDGCVGWAGYHLVYDRFTEDGNGTALVDYVSPSAALGRALTGQVGGVYFNGTNANAANGSAPVILFSPNPWVPGSSYSHVGEIFNGTPNSLMTHSLANGVSEHHPGPVALGMFQDMGWAAVNTAPAISGLPDQVVAMNGSADNIIDLWAYTSDAQTSVNALTFAIANAPDPNAGVIIDGNRYIDIVPAADWSGETDVTIQVLDPGGMSGTDTFKVTVTELSTVYVPLVLRGHTAPPSAWVTILSDDFEGAFPGSTWNVLDEDAGSGLFFWGQRDCRSSSGSFSAWSVGAGDTAINCGSDYANNVAAWMVYGPFSLADATAAEFTFDWWSKTAGDGQDYFFWGASLDDVVYWGPRVHGDWSSWTTGEKLDLSAVPTLGNLLGEEQVWIGFTFISDSSSTDEGSYVDNVVVRKQIGAAASGSEGPVPPQRILQPNQSVEFVGIQRDR